MSKCLTEQHDIGRIRYLLSKGKSITGNEAVEFRELSARCIDGLIEDAITARELETKLEQATSVIIQMRNAFSGVKGKESQLYANTAAMMFLEGLEQ